MRTTIELPSEQRARLLDMAARRGEKGFSNLIQDALTRFLQEEDQRNERVRDALDALGTLDQEEGDALDESVRRARSSWR